jgi:hypothetical protein
MTTLAFIIPPNVELLDLAGSQQKELYFAPVVSLTCTVLKKSASSVCMSSKATLGFEVLFRPSRFFIGIRFVQHATIYKPKADSITTHLLRYVYNDI